MNTDGSGLVLGFYVHPMNYVDVAPRQINIQKFSQFYNVLRIIFVFSFQTSASEGDSLLLFSDAMIVAKVCENEISSSWSSAVAGLSLLVELLNFFHFCLPIFGVFNIYYIFEGLWPLK